MFEDSWTTYNRHINRHSKLLRVALVIVSFVIESSLWEQTNNVMASSLFFNLNVNPSQW
jgi:hypothetical protein